MFLVDVFKEVIDFCYIVFDVFIIFFDYDDFWVVFVVFEVYVWWVYWVYNVLYFDYEVGEKGGEFYIIIWWFKFGGY